MRLRGREFGGRALRLPLIQKRTTEAAVEMELAEALRTEGYTVTGGK